MISRASELLAEFINKERKALEEVEIPHMPTLGEAYEAIAAQGIDQQFAIPKFLGLKVVSGFVTVGDRQLPNQVDCMLVDGEGQRIGLTDHHIYPIERVLCLVEVKKTLTKDDLLDAMHHLGAIKRAASGRIAELLDREEFSADISQLRLHFAQISGHAAPESLSDRLLQPLERKLLFHSLLTDHFTPATVILGFDGHKTEAGLRGAFASILEEHLGPDGGFGVTGLPSLVLASNFSLVKCNGLPYILKRAPNDWVVVASVRENPIRILLEVLWTKIAQYYGVGMPWNDGLAMESLSPLLNAAVVHHEGATGWRYNSVEPNEASLRHRPAMSWEPARLTARAVTLFGLLIAKGGWVDTCDDDLSAYLLMKYQQSLDEICAELIGTGYFMREGRNLRPIHMHSFLLGVADGTGHLAHDKAKFDEWCEKHGHAPHYLSLLLVDDDELGDKS